MNFQFDREEFWDGDLVTETTGVKDMSQIL